MRIIKADGSSEEFKEEKLHASLKKAGADEGEIGDIFARIRRELFEGMSTEEIYRRAFQYLREEGVPAAARYSLRRALFGLGPTGFPFEDFLARIFESEGYTVTVGTIVEGNCVPHEIDIAAYKRDHSFVAEAKFHARPGIKSDLQVALYCQARKLDLAERKICDQDICGIRDFRIITNTKFTSMAKRYADCVGLSLLSWEYPKVGNLHEKIRTSGLYPITVLQNLSMAQKQALLNLNIIVCTDLVKRPHVLRHVHLSDRKVEATLMEARQLCGALE
jgi:hypothetical protein